LVIPVPRLQDIREYRSEAYFAMLDAVTEVTHKFNSPAVKIFDAKRITRAGLPYPQVTTTVQPRFRPHEPDGWSD